MTLYRVRARWSDGEWKDHGTRSVLPAAVDLADEGARRNPGQTWQVVTDHDTVGALVFHEACIAEARSTFGPVDRWGLLPEGQVMTTALQAQIDAVQEAGQQADAITTGKVKLVMVEVTGQQAMAIVDTEQGPMPFSDLTAAKEYLQDIIAKYTLLRSLVPVDKVAEGDLAYVRGELAAIGGGNASGQTYRLQINSSTGSTKWLTIGPEVFAAIAGELLQAAAQGRRYE